MGPYSSNLGSKHITTIGLIMPFFLTFAVHILTFGFIFIMMNAKKYESIQYKE